MVKMSVASAKRLGYVIESYQYQKGKKTLTPILKKSKKKKTPRKINKNTTPLIDCGIIQKLDIEKIYQN